MVPYRPLLPRTPQLRLVIQNVLIMSVQGIELRRPRSRDRSLESRRLRDNEVGRNPSVRPPAYPKLVRVDQSLGDRVIHHRYVVLKIFVAPIRKDRLRVILTAPR